MTDVALQRVARFFSELTTGQKPALSFSKNPFVRESFLSACATILRGTEERHGTLTSSQTCDLVRKLGNYTNERKLQAPDRIAELERQAETISDAVSEALAANPEALAANKKLATIIQEHQATSQAASAILAAMTKGSKQPFGAPQVIFTTSSGHKLVELTALEHFREDTAALGHCLSTSYNIAALKEKGLTAGSPGSEQYLHYLMKLRAEEIRLFSLRAPDGTPRATMTYDLKENAITEVGGKQYVDGDGFTLQDIHHSAPFYPDICQSLLFLRNDHGIRLKTFTCQTHFYYGEQGAITSRGRTDTPYEGDPRDMLRGILKVTDATPQEDIEYVARDIDLRMDITGLRHTERLPARIIAELIYEGEAPLHLPNTQYIQKLKAGKTSGIHAPLLEELGSGQARNAAIWDTPKLRIIHDYLNIYRCPQPSFPSLEEAKYLAVSESSDLDAPRLRKIETLHGENLRNANLPALENGGWLNLSSASTINMPKATCGEMFAFLATDIKVGRCDSLHNDPTKRLMYDAEGGNYHIVHRYIAAEFNARSQTPQTNLAAFLSSAGKLVAACARKLLFNS